MRISDWSSDVCSSDLGAGRLIEADRRLDDLNEAAGGAIGAPLAIPALAELARLVQRLGVLVSRKLVVADGRSDLELWVRAEPDDGEIRLTLTGRSEEHTSELQSLMRISYAGFCLKKKKTQ